MNIELSETLMNTMQEKGRMIGWARNVVSASKDKSIVLSQEDIEISNSINDYVKRLDKFGSQVAGEQIAQLVNVIVTDEVYNAPSEILDMMFDTASYDEFDKVKVTKNIKNTLIAYESAARTGNVKKSYVDFAKGTVKETHLQIETELKMSDLRRNGALGVAEFALMSLETFNNKKFAIVMDMIDGLITGGANEFECTGGALTLAQLNNFTGYLNDNIVEGTPMAIGLSNVIRKIYQIANIENKMSDDMLTELNQKSYLPVKDGVAFVPVSAGKTMGDGSKLLKADTFYGIAGKAGVMYTKGQIRTLQEVDINREVIHIKFTGMEFGVCITDLKKIAKLFITA